MPFKVGLVLHDGFLVSPIVNNLALTLDMNEKIQFHAILTINITYKSMYYGNVIVMCP